MNIMPAFFIISSNKPHFSKSRAIREHEALGSEIAHPKKVVEGCCKGQIESSWLIVPFDNHDIREDIIRLINRYDQECALHVDPNQAAYFVFPDGAEKHIGTWILATGPVSDYTKDPLTGYKYTVRWKI